MVAVMGPEAKVTQVRMSVPDHAPVHEVVRAVALIHSAGIGGELHIVLPARPNKASRLEIEELVEHLERDGYSISFQGHAVVVPV